jgi:hypothetical protein
MAKTTTENPNKKGRTRLTDSLPHCWDEDQRNTVASPRGIAIEALTEPNTGQQTRDGTFDSLTRKYKVSLLPSIHIIRLL